LGWVRKGTRKGRQATTSIFSLGFTAALLIIPGDLVNTMGLLCMQYSFYRESTTTRVAKFSF